MVVHLVEWRKQVTKMSKDEVAKPSTNRHTQEQPAIVAHGNEHENVAQPHLDYVQQ